MVVSMIRYRTAWDLLCRPGAEAHNIASIQHDHLARCGTHGSQLDYRKHHHMRPFDAGRAGLVSIPWRSERAMDQRLQSDGSFVRKLYFASRSRRRVPSRWPWKMANMRDGTPLEISIKFSAPPERLGAAHAPRGRRSRVPWGTVPICYEG